MSFLELLIKAFILIEESNQHQLTSYLLLGHTVLVLKANLRLCFQFWFQFPNCFPYDFASHLSNHVSNSIHTNLNACIHFQSSMISLCIFLCLQDLKNEHSLRVALPCDHNHTLNRNFWGIHFLLDIQVFLDFNNLFLDLLFLNCSMELFLK